MKPQLISILFFLSLAFLDLGCGLDFAPEASDRSSGQSDAKAADEAQSKTNTAATKDSKSQDKTSAAAGSAGSTNSQVASPPATPVPTSQPGAETCLDADAFTCQVELAITRYTNELRADKGELVYHAKLAVVARDWSKRQSEVGKISHDGFPLERIQLYKTTFGSSETASVLAENVGYTYAGSSAADDVAKIFLKMWSNSAGHRANMLGNYKKIGVGVWKSGNTYYATQIFGN